MKKCNRDCFHCPFEDCIEDDVSEIEKDMSDYRDKCAIVTGLLPTGHGGVNKRRRGGRYDSTKISKKIVRTYLTSKNHKK